MTTRHEYWTHQSVRALVGDRGKVDYGVHSKLLTNIRSVGFKRGSTNAQFLDNLTRRISKNQQPGNLQLPGLSFVALAFFRIARPTSPARLNLSRASGKIQPITPSVRQILARGERIIAKRSRSPIAINSLLIGGEAPRKRPPQQALLGTAKSPAEGRGAVSDKSSY